MKKVIGVLFLCLVFSLAGFFSSCSKRDRMDYYTSMTKSIDSVVDSLNQSGLFSGTVLVADQTGSFYTKAFGLADRSGQRPLKTETPFYLASVSKQFTASAIMLLQQRGKLSFDDPALKYLKELPATVYEHVTIRHMLNHTSGIPDYYTFANPTPGFTNDDVYRILQNIDSLEFVPGDKYAYSNSGYVLLSTLVSKVSGQTFADFMDKEVIEPLKMRHCTVRDEHAAEIQDPAIGYNQEGVVSDYQFYTTGGGGFYASVLDLYQWDRSLYTGEIVEIDLLKNEAWVSGVLNDGQKTGYGFGWQLDPDRPHIVRHGGDLEGFRTHFFRDTNRKIAIIILSNSGYDEVGGLSDRIYKLIEIVD